MPETVDYAVMKALIILLLSQSKFDPDLNKNNNKQISHFIYIFPRSVFVNVNKSR